jgi:arylsulfatase A-like enzyme
MLALPWTCGQSSHRPNIVLIVIDTLRADHVGCYGYQRPTTPALDALAARGVRFEEAISQAPYTKASTASLITGLYPSVHGALGPSDAIAPAATTMASYLKRAGYVTGGFYLNTNVHDLFGFGRGFRHLQSSRGRLPGATRAGSGQRCEHLDLEPRRPRHHRGAALLPEARAPPAPRFIYLHFIGPHDPYTPPKDGPSFLQGPLTPTAAKFYEERLSSSDVQHNTLSALAHGILPLDRDTLQQMRDLYDGEIAFTDRQVGEIVAAFDKVGLTDSTLFIVTSDHGEEFGDHGGLGHGRTQYHELLHVPLIMAGPGIKAGGVVHSPVRLIDVLPTVLDVLKLDPDLALDGASFKDCLAHPEHDLGARELYAEGILPDHPDPYLLRFAPDRQREADPRLLTPREASVRSRHRPGREGELVLTRPQEVSRLFAALVERHEKNRSTALPASPVALDATRGSPAVRDRLCRRTTAIGDTQPHASRELTLLDHAAPRPADGETSARSSAMRRCSRLPTMTSRPSSSSMAGGTRKATRAGWRKSAGVRLKATGGETEWFVEGWIDLKLHARPSITITVQVDGGPKMEFVIDRTSMVNLSGPFAKGGDCFRPARPRLRPRLHPRAAR